VTFRAFDSFKAVETLQASRRSMFSMVRMGTPDRLDNLGMDKLALFLIDFRFTGFHPLQEYVDYYADCRKERQGHYYKVQPC
jgi:hypothetical protein